MVQRQQRKHEDKNVFNFYFSYCLSACNYRLKPAQKKAVAKTTISAGPTIKAPVIGGQPNVVVKRPPTTPIPSKPSGVPKPVLKFTSGSKASFFFQAL